MAKAIMGNLIRPQAEIEDSTSEEIGKKYTLTGKKCY